MTYRSVLVHLDGGDRSAVRLHLAAGIARQFGGRLSGVFGESDPHVLSTAARDPAAALAPVATRAEAMFRECAASLGLEADWSAEATVNDTELVKRLLFASRHADLVVLGQHDPGVRDIAVPADLVEQIVLHAGRPVLAVPYAGHFETIGGRVMVAWNASRESARALADALPFLAAAEHVVLVSINPDLAQKEEGDATFPSLRRYLAAHGIEAEGERLWVQDISAMDLLLSRLTDEGIDLLVMGAHGHYGFPHLHRGAGTRHILRHMTVPVLMSH
jgi:nucleotide-binding universal stress UspA family protein